MQVLLLGLEYSGVFHIRFGEVGNAVAINPLVTALGGQRNKFGAIASGTRQIPAMKI